MITKDDVRGEIAASGLESAPFAGTEYSQTEKKLRTREATTTFLRFFGFPTETIETWTFERIMALKHRMLRAWYFSIHGRSLPWCAETG